MRGEAVDPSGVGGPGLSGPSVGGPSPPFMDFMRVKPIKGFVVARAASVQAQLDGTATGTEVAGMGFGGPAGGPPGLAPGPGPGAGPGAGPGSGPGPGAFGPGMFLGPLFMRAMDQDESEDVTRDECDKCFERWHEQWSNDDGGLTMDGLRDGLNQILMPFGPGGPGGPGVPGEPGGGE